MQRIKNYLLIVLFLVSANLYSQSADALMQTGEYLEYEVSFLAIKIGTIKMYIEPQTTYNNIPVYKVKSYIKSYDGIPFLSLDATFESWIDKSANFSHLFTSNIKKKDGWHFQKLDFNYVTNQFQFTHWLNKKQLESKQISTANKWNDGSSLFFVARKNLRNKKRIIVPTIIDADTCFTTINYSGKKETIETDAINYPVRTVYFNGKADWEGLYGLSGKFEGWFSDDEAAIPILAKMNVYIGSVNIELKKWKRANWSPPKAN
jgi:hypothetical protein